MTGTASPDEAEAHIALFVAGGAPRSAAALRNLSTALAALPPPIPAMQVDVIDVLLDPGKALEVGLLATPGLSLILANGQRRWFIGDLGRPEMLVNWLLDNLGDQVRSTSSHVPQADEA